MGTLSPTETPTRTPSTPSPTTEEPSSVPTLTSFPTLEPTSMVPTLNPTVPTDTPTHHPTPAPSHQPYVDCLEVCEALDQLNVLIRARGYLSDAQNSVHVEARKLAEVTARKPKDQMKTTAESMITALSADRNITGCTGALTDNTCPNAEADWNATLAKLRVLGGEWEMGHNQYGHNGHTAPPADHVVADVQLGATPPPVSTPSPAAGCAGGTNCQGTRTVYILVHDESGTTNLKDQVTQAAKDLGSSYVTHVWDPKSPSAAPSTTLDLIKREVQGALAATPNPTHDPTTQQPTLEPTDEPTRHPTLVPTTEDQFNSLTPTLDPTTGSTAHPTLDPTTEHPTVQPSVKPDVVKSTNVESTLLKTIRAEVKKEVAKQNKDDNDHTAAIVLGVIVGLLVLVGFIGVGYYVKVKREDHQARGHVISNAINSQSKRDNLAVA